MIRTCQHCGELILGDAYRVTSEEDGVPLLTWWYVRHVPWKQKDFNCIQSQSILMSNTPLFKMEGVGIRGSGFNALL